MQLVKLLVHSVGMLLLCVGVGALILLSFVESLQQYMPIGYGICMLAAANFGIAVVALLSEIGRTLAALPTKEDTEALLAALRERDKSSPPDNDAD